MQRLRGATALILLATSLIFASCLSVEAHIDAGNPSRIDVDLTYTVDTELWNLGVFDDGTPYRIIPVSRADAHRAAIEARGRLRRYSIDTDDDVTTITIRYRLPDAEALENLFGGDLTMSRDEITLLVSPGLEGATEAQLASLRELLAGTTAAWTVELPGSVTSSEPFGTIDGSRVSVSVPLDELLLGTEAVRWTARWTQE